MDIRASLVSSLPPQESQRITLLNELLNELTVNIFLLLMIKDRLVDSIILKSVILPLNYVQRSCLRD